MTKPENKMVSELRLTLKHLSNTRTHMISLGLAMSNIRKIDDAILVVEQMIERQNK
jgi:hypothetical protein